MNLIDKAREFSHAGHDSIGQKRKYDGSPYWVHTDEVADIVAKYGGTETMIIAAFAHDLVEDVNKFPYNINGITELFGEGVGELVWQLTDQYTMEKYPGTKRDWRKLQEAQRLGHISPNAQTIKLADFLSNTKDIVAHDTSFAKVYLKEKQRAIQYLTRGNNQLYLDVLNQLNTEMVKLGI